MKNCFFYEDKQEYLDYILNLLNFTVQMVKRGVYLELLPIGPRYLSPKFYGLIIRQRNPSPPNSHSLVISHTKP